MSKKAGIWLVGLAAMVLAAGPAVGLEFVDVSKQAGVADDGNWLKITGLGYGAKVALYDGDQLVATHEVHSATGFCAQEPAVVHFGVKPGINYTAKVSFPGGGVASVAVKAGQVVEITE